MYIFKKKNVISLSKYLKKCIIIFIKKTLYQYLLYIKKKIDINIIIL